MPGKWGLASTPFYLSVCKITNNNWNEQRKTMFSLSFKDNIGYVLWRVP